MIPRTVPTWQMQNWQDELAELITDPAELLKRLNLDAEHLPAAKKASAHFPLRATHSYVSRIHKGDIADPLLRQILPIGAETLDTAGFDLDPLAENAMNPVPGLIHKYRSRVLFIASGQCAINCRYCFRRHFPYQKNQPGRSQWQACFDYIAQHPEVNEVILSGGDPLAMSDRQLDWLMTQAQTIPHLRRLRIHTRMPIVVPSRVTPSLLASVTGSRLKPVVVIHSNHPREIDEHVRDALTELKSAGVTVLNQSVLLQGVNDQAETLADLSESLFDAGVLPYYLHLLDKVAGAAHFAVSDEDAKSLYRELLTLLPGFLVPKLVREEPFQPSKTPVSLA